MFACPIEEYRFKASTPTEELMVMCRMLGEAGDYAATILDRAHQTFSRKCRETRKRVEQALIKREGKDVMERVFDVPAEAIDASDLTRLTVGQLHTLFLQRPKRTETRAAEGLGTFTRYFETRIVAELRQRKAATPLEQLKIDYCARINNDELHNMSIVMQLPVGEPCFDARISETPALLGAEIKRLSKFTTVMEHEALSQYIDRALHHLKTLTDRQQGAPLASTLLQAAQNSVISIPGWVLPYLLQALNEWKKRPTLPETEIALPLLTAWWTTRDDRYRRRAQRIINRAYRRATTPKDCSSSLDQCASLTLAEQCADYVTRYSPRKIAAARARLTQPLAEQRRP